MINNKSWNYVAVHYFHFWFDDNNKGSIVIVWTLVWTGVYKSWAPGHDDDDDDDNIFYSSAY